MVDHAIDGQPIVDLLETRGIRLDDYEPGRQLDYWLRQNISSDTLLTREERVFAQRARLASTGTAQGRSAISDDAFETAITSLHASIANIDQQCAILEGHKKALAALRRPDLQQISPALDGQTLTREKAAVDLSVETAASSLRRDLKLQYLKIGSVITSASNLASRAFEKDDKILDSLQKLTPRLQANTDHDAKLNTLETLCKHWTLYEKEAMKRKVDQTFADAVESHRSVPNGVAVKDYRSEAAAVRAELTELSNEVDGLLGLVAEHQYRGSIQRSLDQANRDAEAESAKWSEYTACVLLFLTARLEALHDLHQHSQVYRAALKALQDEMKAITAEHDDEDFRGSPLRESRQNSRGLKPLRLVQATYNDPQETTSQILKLLDIKMKQPVDQESLLAMLDAETKAKKREHAETIKYLDQEQRQTLQRSLDSPDQHLHALLRAIASGTSISSAMAERERLLARLEAQTDGLAARIHSLDVDGLAQSIAQAL